MRTLGVTRPFAGACLLAAFVAAAGLSADPPPAEFFEIWHQPKGKRLGLYSEAPTKAKADEVAKALKVPGGTTEVRGPFFRPVPGSKDNPFRVPKGQVTFDSEGTEGGRYHSRTPHVPSDTSGLTIGRGYDMKEKTKAQIKKDLTDAGLSEADAEAYAGAAGLSGDKARQYIKDTKLVEITPEQEAKPTGRSSPRRSKTSWSTCATAATTRPARGRRFRRWSRRTTSRGLPRSWRTKTTG